MAEKESGFDKKFIEEKGEHMEGGMLGNLAHYLSYGGNIEIMWDMNIKR